MADYNIYIHSSGGNNVTENPTKAWIDKAQQSFTKAWQTDTTPGEIDPMYKTPTFLANEAMDVLESGMMGVMVGVASVVVKGSYQAIKTAASYISAETGDFRVSVQMSNFDAQVKAVFHPVSTTLTALRRDLEIRRENQRREYQRELLGDSEINRYTNRGY